MVVYPYPDVSGGRLVLSNASVFSLEVSTASFADHNGLEAPHMYRHHSMSTTPRGPSSISPKPQRVNSRWLCTTRVTPIDW